METVRQTVLPLCTQAGMPGVLKVQSYSAQIKPIPHRRAVLEATWKCIPAEQYHPQHLPVVDVALQRHETSLWLHQAILNSRQA